MLPTYTKQTSINKIGHGLHYLDPVYRDFTLRNEELKQVARDLAVHKDPQVLQSMIICKNPKIGGKGQSFHLIVRPLLWSSERRD